MVDPDTRLTLEAVSSTSCSTTITEEEAAELLYAYLERVAKAAGE
jgi:hypothetical protein